MGLRIMYVMPLYVLSIVLLHNAFGSASVVCDKLPNPAKLRSHYLDKKDSSNGKQQSRLNVVRSDSRHATVQR